MKKRTVQISRMVIALCLILAVTIVPSIAFASDNDFSVTKQVFTDKNTVWHYLDDNTDPALGYDSLDAWTLSDFDDSAWKSGKGAFGNKSGALGTIFLGTANGYTPNVLLTLNGGSGTDNYKSYFFRTTVNVDNFDDLYALDVYIVADDAMTLYINGNLVADTRVSKNDSSNLHYSKSSNQIYRNWFSEDEIKQLLTEGENTIAVSIHNSDATSSDVYFSMESSLYYATGDAPVDFDDVMMNVGSNETERNLTWYTKVRGESELQLAKAQDMTGEGFPEEYVTFKASVKKADAAVGEYANNSTITGLTENTEYVYRLKTDGEYSEVFSFKTESFDNFDVVVFGDPQIRSWTDSLDTPDYIYWHDTMSKVSASFNADLYLSVGDQINDYTNEKDYTHFITDDFSSTALAPVFGNHESGSTAFNEHYNLPNASNSLNANYWFTYNNVLFIFINSTLAPASNHLSFIESAIAENPECEWQILSMHYSPFSGGAHSTESSVTDFTNNLVPKLNILGIDLVLSGHDHIYSRTYLMDGTEVAADQSGVDSTGVLYVCSGSAGGKFYEESGVTTGLEYVAFTHYEQTRTVVHLEISDSELLLNTYLVDDMSVIDSFTLTHTDSAKLSEALAKAESTISEAETILADGELAAIRASVAGAKEMLAAIEGYTAEEIDALITLLNAQTLALAEAVVEYNTLSAGAKVTAFDTASSLKTVHLKDGGVYTLSGHGSKADVSLIKHNADGTEETVFTWKEGSTYIKMSSSNPYVAFILDGDVTFDSNITLDYTNLLIDLNGHTATFNSSASSNITLSNAAHVEFRGEGTMLMNSSSVTYFLSSATINAVCTLNGNITLVDGTSSLKTLFLFKSDAYIHGTLTIDASYDSSTGIVFSMQGSRSSADDRHSIVYVDEATINYNNPKGGALFGAKGIVGEYNGVTYSSIPELRITNSTLNLSSPMVNNKWGADSVSGYGASKSEPLTNCVNTTLITITDSYVYSDININYPMTISPTGHTYINITRSEFYSEHGVIIQGVASSTLDLTVVDSVFYAGTTDAEATTLGAELGIGAPTSLRGEVLLVPANTLGTATFTNSSLTAAYRVVEGTSDTLSKRTYFIFLKDCSSGLTTGGGHMFARVNLVFDGGLIDCGLGKLSNNATPYDPETGKGLLVKGTVTIVNFPSSGLDDEITSISAYKKKAESDSTVYTTTITSGYFTVADDFNVLSITHENTISGKYSYLLYSTEHDCVLTVTKGTVPTCTEAGINDYYTCFCGKIYADAEAKVPVEDLETYLPLAPLGHKGNATKENEVAPTCTADGKYDNVTYCSACGFEISRETVTIPALGHTAGEAVVENNTAPTCTADGSYDNVVYCSVCNKELNRETVTIPALGHVEGEIVQENVISPDCLNDGSMDEVTYCTVCNTELSRTSYTILARGHVGGVATCAEPKTCENCGMYYGEKLEHSFTNYVHDGNATCTDDGTKTAYCDHFCGAKDTVINTSFAPGHSFGEWTSNGYGVHIRVCQNNPEHTEIEECYGGTATVESRPICSGCGGEYGEKLEREDNETEALPDDDTPLECSHICHKDDDISRIIWNIISFFLKLLGMNDTCPCGAKHY